MSKLSTDTIFRMGIEWITANAYNPNVDLNEMMGSQPVQMLAVLADTTPEWIVQCVARHAQNKPFQVVG